MWTRLSSLFDPPKAWNLVGCSVLLHCPWPNNFQPTPQPEPCLILPILPVSNMIDHLGFPETLHSPLLSDLPSPEYSGVLLSKSWLLSLFFFLMLPWVTASGFVFSCLRSGFLWFSPIPWRRSWREIRHYDHSVLFVLKLCSPSHFFDCRWAYRIEK